jgi:RNA polymerase sigma factor (sigma-70 family)
MLQMQPLVEVQDQVEQIPDPVDVEAEAILAVEADRVRRFIDELPPPEKAVVIWRYGLDGVELSFAEIARRLGVGKVTVWDMEKRALGRLRASYGLSREPEQADLEAPPAREEPLRRAA